MRSVSAVLEPGTAVCLCDTSAHGVSARTPSPVALFLVGSTIESAIPKMAAAAGLRSIALPWRHCQPGGGVVTAQGGWEILSDGRSIPLPMRSTLRPAIVGVLVDRPQALQRGRAAAVACEAFWSHLDVPAPAARRARDHDRHAFGVVDFRPEWSPLRLASPVHAAPPTRDWTEAAQRRFEEHLERLGAGVAPGDPLLHRTLAPCVLYEGEEGRRWSDPLRWLPRPGEEASWRAAIALWLEHVRQRTIVVEPIRLRDAAFAPSDLAIHAEHFPEFFGTPRTINTARQPRATFVFRDSALEPTAALDDLLCRRRSSAESAESMEESEPRLIETGVGRACLVDGLRLRSAPEFHDFTVLGVGLTPFSEGGFVEIGREIDGKAAMLRAWHRKRCAERLTAEGGRAARVVALIELPGEEITMPDGSVSAAALIVRAFRCVLRVKQLDPIVCALHSPQHTPLIAEFLVDRARHLLASTAGIAVSSLYADDALAWTVERQPASQASLREILAATDPGTCDWPALVRRARVEVIEWFAPLLIALARRRLALEWRCHELDITDRDYLVWFADSMASQLRAWRRLRFLHDYHHPGFSRWHPGTLFSLGENNVTLLAEFADLDTGVFVDDADDALRETLQLTDADVLLLRNRYTALHQRDVQAVETVVQTLAAAVFRGDPGAAGEIVGHFRRSLDHA